MAIRDKYQDLRAKGKLHGTITRAVRLRKQRDANPPATEKKAGSYLLRQKILDARRNAGTLVALGDLGRIGTVRAQDRRRLWSAEIADTMDRVSEKGSNSNWRKKSTFQRFLHTRSVANINPRNLQSATYHYSTSTYALVAPRGYHFDVDANGFAFKSTAGDGDYHPSGDELVLASRDRCRSLVAKLKENSATRKAAKAKTKQQLAMLKTAEREGAAVCLRDSIASGNCRAGSEQWARNHNLDPRGHYSPSQILAMANGDASRVAIVVAAAIRRHRREMDCGVCDLSEHS